jgi:hypothetical protein
MQFKDYTFPAPAVCFHDFVIKMTLPVILGDSRSLLPLPSVRFQNVHTPEYRPPQDLGQCELGTQLFGAARSVCVVDERGYALYRHSVNSSILQSFPQGLDSPSNIVNELQTVVIKLLELARNLDPVARQQAGGHKEGAIVLARVNHLPLHLDIQR